MFQHITSPKFFPLSAFLPGFRKLLLWFFLPAVFFLFPCDTAQAEAILGLKRIPSFKEECKIIPGTHNDMTVPPSGNPVNVLLPEGLPYIPPYDSGEIVSYFYEKPLAEFLPGNYRNIYPYIGGRYYSEMDVYTYLYGLCDASGQIICDAVYDRIYLLKQNSSYIYLLQRNYKTQYVVTESGYGYYLGDTEHIFVALDGGWMRSFEDSVYGHLQYRTNSTDSNLIPPTNGISVKDENGWGVMDFDGNMIYPCKENGPVLFSDGLAAVWNKEGTQYHYMDEDGNIRLGPFDSPPDYSNSGIEYFFYNRQVHFSYGLAMFMENDLYGFMDTQGNVVIDPIYSYAQAFDGEKIYCAPADGGPAYYIDKNGQWLAACDDGDSSTTLLNNGWMVSYLNDETILTREEYSLTLPGTYTVNGINKNRILLCWYEENTGEEWYMLINAEGKELIPPTRGYAYYTRGYLQVYHHEGRRIAENPTTLWGIYDLDGNEILPVEFSHIDVYDHHFLVVKEIYSGIINENGQWLLKLLIDEDN